MFANWIPRIIIMVEVSEQEEKTAMSLVRPTWLVISNIWINSVCCSFSTSFVLITKSSLNGNGSTSNFPFLQAQVVPMVCQARQINASPVHDTRARFPHCTVYSPTGTSSPVKGIGMRFRTPNMVYPSHPCSPVNGQ